MKITRFFKQAAVVSMLLLAGVSQAAPTYQFRVSSKDLPESPAAAPAQPGDPYAANVSALLHMDTASFSDQKGGLAPTNVGGVSLSPTFKYGSGSAQFNGSNYLNLGRPAALNFGAGDFTMEFWFSLDATSHPYQTFMGQWGQASDTYGFCMGLLSTNGNPYFQWGTGNGGNDYITTPKTFAVGSWNHYAVTRQGSTVRLFINGNLEASKPLGTQTLPFTGVDIYMGNIVQPHGSDYYFAGRIDELRVTKGVARYTANFTPAAAPFPDN